MTKDTHCVVYRKPYKDTQLYQYKVLGYFDDITAKDFLDIQVGCVYNGTSLFQTFRDRLQCLD